MEKILSPTQEQYLQSLIVATETMTQAQIDACSWCMGGAGCGWTKEKLKESLESDLTMARRLDISKTIW